MTANTIMKSNKQLKMIRKMHNKMQQESIYPVFIVDQLNLGAFCFGQRKESEQSLTKLEEKKRRKEK